MDKDYPDVVQISRDYYNSKDADEFYFNIWGGEDIHVGIYKSEDEAIVDASRRTVARMASMLKGLSKDSKVLDIGSGYGGVARYLAQKYGCSITCLNLSERENARNKEKNEQNNLSQFINVVDGSFEEIPSDDSAFDFVWSEDAILHSDNKQKVFEEVFRILKPAGEFIFTDPMQSDDCPEGVLQAVYDRINLDSMGSFGLYERFASGLGMETVQILNLSNNLITHYGRVHEELEKRYDEIINISSKKYVDQMLKGLNAWIEAGNKNYLTWGILHFRKK